MTSDRAYEIIYRALSLGVSESDLGMKEKLLLLAILHKAAFLDLSKSDGARQMASMMNVSTRTVRRALLRVEQWATAKYQTEGK